MQERYITISVRLEESLVAHLDQLARNSGSTRSAFMRRILAEHVDSLDESVFKPRASRYLLGENGQ